MDDNRFVKQLAEARKNKQEKINRQDQLAVDTLLSEYQKMQNEGVDILRVPERWGAIMIPLSIGILVFAISSIENLHPIGTILLVSVSIATLSIWKETVNLTVERQKDLGVLLEGLSLELYEKTNDSFFKPLQKGTYFSSKSSYILFFGRKESELLQKFFWLYALTGLFVIGFRVALYCNLIN